jgi:hypothetical protein
MMALSWAGARTKAGPANKTLDWAAAKHKTRTANYGKQISNFQSDANGLKRLKIEHCKGHPTVLKTIKSVKNCQSCTQSTERRLMKMFQNLKESLRISFW